MKIIFFGSSQFALPSLQCLTETNHDILAIVTQPDKKAGRGLKISPTVIKASALEKGIPVLQPEWPNKDEAFLKRLKELKVDVFVVVSYGHILTKNILDMPFFFSINLHPSLLPKYRGAAPINWAIINGDRKTGVSIIKMTRQMDAGPIICQETEEISGADTAISLAERLSRKGAEVLVKSLSLIENCKVVLKSQAEGIVSFAPKLKKEDGRVNFNLTALELHNRIRGMLGWPTAFTFFCGRRIELLESGYEEIKTSCLPSKIIELGRDEIKVAAGEGILIIKKVKPEGKKEMPAGDFAHGYRLKKGDKFDGEKRSS